ncbi:MAG: N-6 DNA methylase [Bacteroidales bacterium]|nr:N-6 DNA methylase [Bacteroidales bacterium]
MTLHEAIEYTIQNKGPASFSEITAFINDNRLYIRSDKKPVPINQVRRRVHANPDMFKILNDTIYLQEDISIEGVLNIIEEPIEVYVPEKDKGELNNMFQQMLDILWESGFKGLPEHHISTMYFFAVIPIIFEKADIRFRYERFDKIYELKGNERIDKYFDQLLVLNKQSPFIDIFSQVLAEKNYIYDSSEAYQKLFFLINSYEVTIWRDPYIGGWLSDFISAYSNSDFKGRIYSTPADIRTILTTLVTTLSFKKIYDPAAGTGSLIADICRATSPKEIYCQEKNKGIYSLLRMNILSNSSDKTFFSNNDSLKSEFIKPGSVDLIVSDLPWEIKRITKSPDQGKPGSRTEIYTESLFIEDAIKRLNNNGIAILNTSFNFLYAPATVKIREKLIKNDFLDTVIAIPPGFYKPFSNCRSAIIVLTKSKTAQKRNKTFFIDLADLINDKEVSGRLKSVFHNWTVLPEKTTIADSKRISEENFSIMPAKYLVNVLYIPLRTGESLVRLKNVIEDYKGKNYKWIKNEPALPFFKVGSLIDSIETPYLNISNGELTGPVNSKGTLISDSVLLISRVGDKLKPQYFEYTGNPIVLNPNILAFRIDSNKIIPEYLIYELKSKFFTDQLQGIRKYSGITNFSRSDFLTLSIRLPEMKQDQEIKVREQKENYLGELETELRLKREKLIGKQTQLDLISTIKHNLSQKLSVLSNDIDFLIQTLDKLKKPEISVHKPFSEFTEESIMQIISRMGTMINDSKETLLKTENYIRVINNENVKESINIYEFLENKIKPLYKNYQSVNIKVECKPETRKEVIVSLNSFLLKELFVNFIQNAIDHGFVDDTMIYEIRFLTTVDYKSSKVRIIISNNGYPLPEDFSIDTLLKFGEKSGESGGTGIGGAVIGKILDIAGGEIRIPEKDELTHSRYSVNFEICLPLNQ